MERQLKGNFEWLSCQVRAVFFLCRRLSENVMCVHWQVCGSPCFLMYLVQWTLKRCRHLDTCEKSTGHQSHRKRVTSHLECLLKVCVGVKGGWPSEQAVTTATLPKLYNIYTVH